MPKLIVPIFLVVISTFSTRMALSSETVTIALTAKPFQYTPLVIAQEREGAIAATVKFTEFDRPLVTRMYDDLVKTFTAGAHVDEETQKNDLAIVKLVAEVTEVVPNNKAYDFSFARQAEAQLIKQGWKP